MRTSRALAVAAAVLAPALLIIIPATKSSAQPANVCGAITMHPECPGVDNQAPPNSVPTFPYTTIGGGSTQ